MNYNDQFNSAVETSNQEKEKLTKLLTQSEKEIS